MHATPGRPTSRAFRLVLTTLIAAAAVPVVDPQPAAASPTGDWTQIQAILGGIQGKATAPIKNVNTPKYTAGMLLGNGDIGVVAGGDTTSDQKFYFGKGDFWGTAWNSGHQQLVTAILSLGSLTLSSPTPSPAPSPVYRMTQDILHAEVDSTVQLGGATVGMRSYTADSGNTFVTELSSPPGSPSVTINVALAMPVPDTHTTYPTTVAGSGGTIVATRHNNLTGSGDFQSEAAIAVRPVGLGFSGTKTSGNTVVGTFTLNAGTPVELATVFTSDARTGHGGPSASSLAANATATVDGLSTSDIASLLADHQAWWKNFWLKSYVQLGDPTMMAYWYGALYVMGACSRPGKVAPDMNGAWVLSDFTQFPRYWMNYNFEAPFYGVASANHPELIQPYLVQQNAETPWQINYTAGGGYQGEMFQRSLGPFHQFAGPPSPAPVAPTKNDRWTDQKSNGGFSVMPALFYYDYTQDQNYLKTTLYPNLRAVDNFFRDYLTWDGTRFVMAHSSAHEGSNDLNPNLDLGFIRRVETFLIQASQQLGVDANLVPVWRNVLAHLSAYPTATVNGQTVYTMAENINGLTNVADTFKPGDQPINLEGGVFPGENIYLGGDPAQVQLAVNTLRQMNSWGVTSGENKNNGFPKEFPIAARVGWPAADLESKFDAAIQAQWRASNLTVAQSGGGIETSGSIEAVDSMLMQSVSGTIRLFGDADWPVSRDASFTRLRAQGAFTVSAGIAAGTVGPVTITSEAGGTARLKVPWSTGTVTVTVLDASGNPTGPVPSTVSGGVVTFTTVAATTYRVTNGASGTAVRLPLTGSGLVLPCVAGGLLLVGLGAALLRLARSRAGASNPGTA